MRQVYILILLFIGLVGCKKASYLTDDGLHTAEVNMSTYDYLASHPHHMFDTLIMMIDHFDLKDEVNNAKTFWVPTDYSINKLMKLKKSRVQEIDENADYTYEEFLEDLPLDSLKAYFSYSNTYDLSTASPSYTALNNGTGITGFAYHKQKQAMSSWSYQDIFYLYYVMVRGDADETAPDGTPRISRSDPADVRVLCQTTGIKTNTGTVINVLNSQHVFISDFNEGADGPLVEDLPDGSLRFTHTLDLKPVSSGYPITPVEVNREWIAETFGLESADIPAMINSGAIKFGAIRADGTLNTTSTANAPGHWFAADGSVVSWGSSAKMFSEYATATFTFNVGQYPGGSAIGDTYKLRQAMEYTNRLNKTLRVEFVFNISIK